MSEKEKATSLLQDWKGDSYIFGLDVLDNIGNIVSHLGDDVLLFGSSSPWAEKPMDIIIESLEGENISVKKILGARPNCPREDLYRMALQLAYHDPDFVISFGGGSTIDGVKAASVLASYSPMEVAENLNVKWDIADSIDPFFGTGMVSEMIDSTEKNIIPIVAVQSASGSAAHLTKYSNITDPIEAQKKLIVDEGIVPTQALFDYRITVGSPRDLTLDGGWDGISHIWEVFMGAAGKDYYEKMEEISVLGISLIVNNLKEALNDDIEARVAIGMGTDLGGYSIMIGGTNGPHLGSFSLVDVASHGRACAVLTPYYTVFFSPNIQGQLRSIAPIYEKAGYMDRDQREMEGRELGEAIARAMLEFNRNLGFPTTLTEAGAPEDYIDKMLVAAKDPQLEMKLLNMPVPMKTEEGDIDRYMKKILEAAFTGDLDKIELKS
jgi:alcohol dehydrogenase class IV